VTCREAIDLFADFLAAAVPPVALARLEAHLGGCDECRAYLATYRRTREVTTRSAPPVMPAELRDRLQRFLLAELGHPGEGRGGAAPPVPSPPRDREGDSDVTR
jgi:anti-sigma factor RsiW